MSLTDITIGPDTPQWHEAYLRYAPRVFPSISFRGWYDLGGWDAGYRAFAIAEGDEIVANASLQRMRVVLNGRELRGWQLGAVGVLPEFRGRGLQHRIMERLMQVPEQDDLVYLFANDTVLEFYPRFGFERAIEHLYGVDVDVVPAKGQRLRRLSLTSVEDRQQVKRIAASALPVTREFGARDYGGVLLWYWANFYQECFYCDDENDVVIVAVRHDDRLEICDVVTDHPVDLPGYLPRIAERTVHGVEFGFTPEFVWPTARVIREYAESPLFVLRGTALPTVPFKYPVLART